MVQETVQAVKDAEARAGEKIREAQEQGEKIVNEAREAAKAQKEKAVAQAREKAEAKMQETKAAGSKMLEEAAKEAQKEVEVLKVAHHGSRYSSSGRVLERVHPAVSLISCSATNRYGHPGAETLERLRDAESRICATKDCGAIRIWTDGKKVRMRCVKKPVFL